MKSLETISQGGISYMVLRLDENDIIDDLAVGMLRNNQIPGLLSMAKRYEHSAYALYYTISSLTPLAQSYAALGSEKRLMQFLKDYCMVIKNCEEYLLEPKRLLLDEHYIFIKAATGELSIPYVAVVNTEPKEDVNTFFMAFVHKVVPYLPPESNILPILYEQNFRGTFDPDALIKALSKLEEKNRPIPPHPIPALVSPQPVPAPTPAPQLTPQPIPQPVPQPVPQPYAGGTENKGGKNGKGGLFKFFNSNKPKSQGVKNEKAKKKASAPVEPLPWDNPFAAANPVPENPPAQLPESTPQRNSPAWPGIQSQPVRNVPPAAVGSGYTVHWNDMESGIPGGTIRMKEEDIEVPGSYPAKERTPVLWLVHQGDNHREEITHSNFHVGRKLDGDEVVDYAVANPTGYMGADHAYFEIKDNKFYVVDNNSKNGTWLNKQKLQPSVPYLVKGGDMIRMADEVFVLDQR